MASIFDEIDAIETSRTSIFDEIDSIDTRDMMRRPAASPSMDGSSSASLQPLEEQAPRPTLGERAWLTAQKNFAESPFGLLARTKVPLDPEGASFGQAARAMPPGMNSLAGLMNFFEAPSSAEEAVALRKRYDEMPAAETLGEYTANVVGFVGSGFADPTNAIPVTRAATLGKTLLKGAGIVGAIGAVSDTAIQGVDIAQGIQKDFDWGRLGFSTLLSAGIGSLGNATPQVLSKIRARIKTLRADPSLKPADSQALDALEQRLEELGKTQDKAPDVPEQFKERAEAIEQQLAADERLRQSQQGAEALKAQLAKEQAGTPLLNRIETESAEDAESLISRYNQTQGAFTGESKRLGLSLKDPKELDALRAAYAASAVRNANLRAAGFVENFDAIGAESDKGQYFREAIDAAEGQPGIREKILAENPNAIFPFDVVRKPKAGGPQTIDDYLVEAEVQSLRKALAEGQIGGPDTASVAREMSDEAANKLALRTQLEALDLSKQQAALRRQSVTQKLSPQAQRMVDQAGFAKSPVLQAVAGGGTGFVIGSFQGDTPQERISNAMLGAGIGATSPFLLSQLADLRPTKRTPLPKDVETFAKAFEKPPGPSRLSKLAQVPARAYQQFISKFSPFNEAESTLRKDAGLPAATLPIARKFEQLAGAAGKAEADLVRFDRAIAEPIAGKEREFNLFLALKRTMDRLSKQDERFAKITDEVTQAETEATAAREAWKKNKTLEMAKKAVAARKKVKGLKKDAQEAFNSRAVGDYTLSGAQKIYGNFVEHVGPENMKLFEAVGQKYQGFMDDALKLQVQSGRMSQEAFDAIKEMNDFYAPFRVLKHIDDIDVAAGTGRRIDTTAKFTKAIKGVSAEDFKIEDILLASRQNIARSRILAEKNLKMQELAALESIDPDGKFVRRLKAGDKPTEGRDIANVFLNGEDVTYEVTGPMAVALRDLNAAQTSVAMKAAALAAYPLRLGATGANVGFQMVNLALADLPRLALVSKYGIGSGTGLVNRTVETLRLALDYAHALASSIRGNFGSPDSLYMQWLDSGGARSTIQDHLQDMGFGFRQGIAPARRIRQPRGVLGTVGAMANSIEETSKLVGLKRGVRQANFDSLTPEQQRRAMEKIVTEVRNYSGSPDFGRRGTHTLNANILFMFLNARIQGVESDMRRLLGADGAKTAAATWAKIGAAVGTPTVALWLHNQSAENRDDFQKVPKTERDNYAMIPRYNEDGSPKYFTNSEGQQVRDYYRIPKRETMKLFANMTESFLEFNKERDPEHLWQFGVSFMENVSPVNISGRNFEERIESVISSTNPLIKAPIQLSIGRNTFFHRDTIPQRLQGGFGGIDPELQFKDSTPKLFVQAATAFPDFLPERLRSPLYLEQLTQDLSAGLVTQFVTGKLAEGREPWTAAPGTKRFARSEFVENEKVLDMVRAEDRAETNTRVIGLRNAVELIDAIKILPQEQKQPALRAALEKDPMILKYMAEALKADAKNYTFQDRTVLGLGVESGARSRFYNNLIKDMTPEQKKEFLLDQIDKGLMSPEVLQQLAIQKASSGGN